jgi:hypothetical protein
VTTSAEGFGSLLLNFLTSSFSHQRQGQEKLQLKRDLIAALHRDIEDTNVTEISLPSISDSRQKKLQAVNLAHLRYPGMEDREARICEAYEATFQWLFKGNAQHDKKWSNFKDWLESDSQLYWITGKAGSGKSTLMKYICQTDTSTNTISGSVPQIRCTKYLNNWASGCKLITATFFFWNSGLSLQMTQSGLFRSLLSQILEQAPQLLPFVAPERWEALCLFNEDPTDWTEQELRQMLHLTAKNLAEDTKLCLFIDGLDEFNGDHNVLIHVFKDLLAAPNVKLCVSSRPWIVFEDAFQHTPSLTLQDLTYLDIKHYVSSELYENPNFSLLREREPLYSDNLVENIVSKASGVFLWVRLVVGSLLTGMGHGDRIVDLQRRLDLLPPELEELYDKMLHSLDPFYLEHAAQLFMLVHESPDPPPVLLLSFADEENWKFALDRPIETISQKEGSRRADTMRRRLNSRCRGFLEVSGSNRSLMENRFNDYANAPTVQYLHRTVKDFVESPKVQEKLKSAMQTPFDPHLSLCAANVAYLKAVDQEVITPVDTAFWQIVTRCMYSTSRMLSKNYEAVTALMEELDKTGGMLAKLGSKHLASPNVKHLAEFGMWVQLHPLSQCSQPFGNHFLSLAIRYGVVEYVEAKVTKGCLLQWSGEQHFVLRNGIRVYPLLLDAVTTSDAWRKEYRDRVPDPAMVQCLLRKGADPNTEAVSRYSTIWGIAQRGMAKDITEGMLISPWAMTADLMLKYGAEMVSDSQSLKDTHWRLLRAADRCT